MPLKLAVQKYRPAVNPDAVFLKATITGAYTQVTGEPVDLTPANWTDPNGLGIVGPSSLPVIPAMVANQSLGGYYAEVTKGTTLANSFVRFFSSQGAELAAGAYPAAITGGSLIFELVF